MVKAGMDCLQVKVGCQPVANETEAKLKVRGLAAARRALRGAGAEYLETVVQTDMYLDTPDRRLHSTDRGMRLRRIRRLCTRQGGRRDEAVLTFKGPRQPHCNVKIRQQVETTVDDPDTLAELLKACGLTPTMTIQKRRSSYRLGRCRVELDELPLIGCFVEVEGPDEEAVAEARQTLSLDGEPILTPYTSLIAEHCRAHGIRRRTITLEE